VVLFVVDASLPPREADREALRLLQSIETPTLLVLNKIDLITEEILAERREEYAALGSFSDTIAVSAVQEAGTQGLLQRTEELLPIGPMYYPAEMVSDHPDSFLIAELVREQALLQTQKEVPYSLAVIVEEMAPRPEDLIYVRAVLYVERDSQKKILIGQGGNKLREIGKAARAQAEALLGKRIFLDLWVKVREHWRDDESVLARFGYPIPKKRKKRKAR